MLWIILQVALAAALLVGAFRLQVSLHRQRSREWSQILAGLSQSGGSLSQLSYGSIFSAGLDCPVAEVWDKIDGTRGLWAIFRNAGVLLEALNYMESDCETSPSFLQLIGHIRENGRRVRIAAAVGLLKSLLSTPRQRPVLTAGEIAAVYIALVAEMSLAISDNCPELLIEYRYSITQS